MKKLALAALVAALGNPVSAASPAPAGLPTTDVAQSILERDPAVMAARSALDAAKHEAEAISSSPYEWTPRVIGQQRRVDGGARYNEWNVGVERGIRLPGKAEKDRRIGELTVEVARARHGEALHETALEFMTRWMDWQAAEHALALAERNLQSMRQSVDAVERRVRAGDASRMEQGLAQAELADQARLHAEARAAAASAWIKVVSRFPSAPKHVEPLAAVEPLDRDLAFWRERVLAESDELKIVVALEQKARARAERLRADRIPDPTVSIFTASELGGAERLAGIGISIPLPGGARAAKSSQAVAEAAVSAQEVELKRREVEERVAVAYAAVQSAQEIAVLADQGAGAMAENARLAQRAYELGESDLATLLLARRQAISAAVNATQARLAALKSSHALRIHAHLVWGLDRMEAE